jgi:hypothetical protein
VTVQGSWLRLRDASGLTDSALNIGRERGEIMVDSQVGVRQPDRLAEHEENQTGRSMFRIGAVCLIFGFVIFMVCGSILHPQVKDANNMLMSFTAYAASNSWTAVHLGEVLGAWMALIVGFYAIYRSLLVEAPGVRHLARLGYVLAIITAALAGVLHAAVDGIALKLAVNAWNTADGTDKLAAFAAAEGIRWTEMSLNSIYDVAGGLAIFALATAMVVSRRYPTWVGLVGAVWGLGNVAIGLFVAYVGFDPEKAGFLLPVTQVASLVWLVATGVLLWRRFPAGSVLVD